MALTIHRIEMTSNEGTLVSDHRESIHRGHRTVLGKDSQVGIKRGVQGAVGVEFGEPHARKTVRGKKCSPDQQLSVSQHCQGKNLPIHSCAGVEGRIQ